MKIQVGYCLIFFSLLVFAGQNNAQANEFCVEENLNPVINSPADRLPYGQIRLKGLPSDKKHPRITVLLMDTQNSSSRFTVDKSGKYCLRLRTKSGGTLIVEVDGVEVERRNVSSFGPGQQREDFDLYPVRKDETPAPGVVSAKFFYPVNSKTVELYKKTAEAETKKNIEKAIEYLNQIVSIDPLDFTGWAKLGVLYLEKKMISEGEAAFKKSLELKDEYTPALIQIGLIRVYQNQFEAASEIFLKVTTLEPDSPIAFRLLGEAYLQTRKGKLAVEALNQAIRLDPVGMAECHLLLARLYDLAGAKQLATREYKLFMKKVPDHSDKKKFEQYIKNNPE
jgi:tetratricopeptide (TPR) repeat protein